MKHRLLNSVSHIAFAPETGTGTGTGTGSGTAEQTAATPPPTTTPNTGGHDATFGGLVTPPGTNAAEESASQNAGGSPAAPPADPSENQPPATGKAYQPDGLPDDLLGANDQETIDKLLASQAKGEAPQTPADYKFEFDDDIKDVFQAAENDPVLLGWSDVAHKHGLSNEQANSLISDVMKDWMDKGLVAKPAKPEEFWNALAEKGGGTESGQKRVNEAAAFVQGLENSKVLTAEQKISLTQFATAAPENVAIIEALKGAMGSHGIQTGGDPTIPASFTKSDLAKRRADPRNDSQNHAQYDPKYRAETDRLAKSLLKAES